MDQEKRNKMGRLLGILHRMEAHTVSAREGLHLQSLLFPQSFSQSIFMWRPRRFFLFFFKSIVLCAFVELHETRDGREWGLMTKGEKKDNTLHFPFHFRSINFFICAVVIRLDGVFMCCVMWLQRIHVPDVFTLPILARWPRFEGLWLRKGSRRSGDDFIWMPEERFIFPLHSSRI